MTRLPAIVEPQAKRFKKIFRNKAQCQHFKQYVTGLMLCDNKTVMGIQSKYLNSGSTNSLDHFMIRSEWSATEFNDKRIADLQQRTETASKSNGFICIDDTLTHKTGKHMDDAELHFDLSTRKFILGQNIVSIQYKDRNISYPIDFRQYYRKPTEQELKKQYRKLEKQVDLFEPIKYFIVKLKLLLDYQHRLQRFQSKIELAIELIHKAEAMRINAETYGFDSWFLGKDMIQVIAGYDKDWISILKSNWNLMMKIEKIFEIYQPERVYISSMIVQDVNLAQAEFDKICYIAAEHKASVFVGGWGFNTIEFNHPVVERRFHSFEELDSSLSKLLEVVAQSDN